MQRKLSLILVMLMILSTVCMPFVMAADITAISITQNKCFYLGEDRASEALKVTATLADGSETDLTGDSGITYASSDETVFKFEGNKLSSTGKNGKAIISAVYGGKTAKMVMARQDAKTAANQPITADVHVSGYNNISYITSGTPGTAEGGHYDGNALSNWANNWTVRLMRKSWAQNNDPEKPGTDMENRWYDSGYRSVAGWFYDDGDTGHKQGYDFVVFTDSSLFHQNSKFEEDYGYGDFAAKWKGMNSWQIVSSGIMRGQGDEYINGTPYGGNYGIKARKKGWHQFVMSLEKNSEAEYGWTVYTYLDGDLVGTKDVVPEEETMPAGITDCNSWAAIEIRPVYQDGYKNYMDDMVLMGSLEKRKEPTAPVVSSVSIEGLQMEGQKLTASAKIYDADDDKLDTPLYQWQSSADGSAWDDIAGETADTIDLKKEYVGKMLRIVVTPRSTVDPKVGAPAASDPTSKIVEAVTPPSAKDVSVTGVPDTGKNLTAAYTYVPSESNVEEGATKFVWEISDTEGGTYTELKGGTSKIYTVMQADAEKYIRVKVIPTDKHGIPGTPVVSAAIKTNKYTEPVAASAYYVAKNGNDENDGTIDAPFATIEKARDVLESIKLPEGGVTVYVRGGTYQITKTIEFGAKNSGTAERPITYQAYNGEKVEFVGGKTLDTSKIKKVTDEAILNRLVDQDARKNLYMLDLAEQGVKMSKIASYGNGFADYNPNEIYMNNMLLTNARWPNNDESQGLVQAAPVSEEGYNAVGQKYKYSFPDPENRSAKWTIKSGDAYMGGALVYFWADSSYTIDTFDKEAKTVTTVNNTNIAATPGAGWGQQYKVYFGNIFEEIDVPGEMYVDREKNILYFYPLVDVNGCEMVVSTTDKNMLDFNGASNITFKGIDFKETRKTPVNIENSDNIKIEGGEISGSAQSGIKILNSTNCKITGCHMFNIASSAIYLQGGDRETLKPSNNIIENNYIHAVNYRPGDRFAITMHDTVGVTVSHNEFDDLPHAAIDIRKSNDITIEYNTISHALYFDSDMGSIYWGRDNTTMGIVVRYNYFRDFETDLWAIQDGYGDGVFWDDGAVGPELYGNVFYNGARHYSSIRANGGEVQNVYNNLIIDDNNTTQYAAFLFGWGTHCWGPEYTYNGKKVDPSIPANTWLYMTDMRTVIGTAEGSPNRAEGNSNLWVPYNRAHYLWSDAWKEHYKDTIWAKNIELYSQKNYEGAKKFFDAKDEYGLLQYIDENFPKGYNNEYHNNVMIGQTRILPIYNGNINHDNYSNENVNTAKSLFKDYGKDFTLTDEGLRTVKASAPEFEQIPFNQMGRTTDNWGHKPSVTVKSDIVSGIAAAGGEISASYDFTDADGDKEGLTQIYWYVADKKNGEYTMSEGKAGKTLELTDEYAGRYIKYKVIPYDTNTMRGETVMSEPVKVREASSIDLTALNAAMKAAREALEGATVGTGAGQYPQAAYDELTAALSEAQTAANDPELTQYAANNAAAKLEAAVAKFEKQKIPAIDMDKIVHMNINPLLADSGNWDNPGGNMKFENGSMVIDAANFDLATYKAAKYLNHEISFKVKFEPSDESGWVGIYFRQPATNKKVWESGGGGLMYDIKKDIMNIQQHDGGKIAGEDAMIDTVANNFLSFGEEHIVTLGVYDTDEANKVFWQLKVDGNVVYEKSTEIRDLYGKEGYFGFSSGKGKLTISPTEADKTKLAEKIAKAENMTFVAGNGYGEYPKDKVDDFNKALADAKTANARNDLTQYDVDKAIENINDAIEVLDESVITKETVTADKTIKINSKYPKAEIKAEKSANDVKLETEKNTSLPGIKITAERSIGTVTAEIFEDTKLSGNGTLLAAKELSEPSVTLNNTANVTVISMADGSLAADKAVRIVLPGQAKKNLGIIVNGKFSRVTKKLSEDSEKTADSELKAGETAFIKSGDDYIIWTKVLGEFATYNTSSSDDGNSNDQPGGGSGKGGTTNNPYGNKGNGGFYSTDTTNPNLDTTVCFNDIQNHWAKADIMAMYRLGVVSGVNDTTFDPDRNITRAEFAALIARALKLSEDAPSVFSDVEKGSWYETSVNACAKAEIITGFDGKFRPNDTITRNEMAVIISNAYSYLGKKGENGGIDKFTDKSEIADWAKPSVDVCTTVGLISGMTDTTFEGDKTATRAQAASILKRLLDK